MTVFRQELRHIVKHTHTMARLFVVLVAIWLLAVPTVHVSANNTSSRAAADPWTTLEQATLSSVLTVAVTPDGQHAASCIQSTATDHKSGKLITSTEISVSDRAALELRGASAVSLGAGTDPAFDKQGARLCFLRDGGLWCSSKEGADRWQTPKQLNTTTEYGATVLHFEFSPDGTGIAFTVAESHQVDPLAPRILDEDVIINVITGAPKTTRNVLCVLEGDSAPRCFGDVILDSVGIAGWSISCWPFDSQFSWGPGNKIAFTTTNNTYTNDVFESLGLAVIDIKTKEITQLGKGIFQPIFGPTGQLAVTKLWDGNYTWAQTWDVCLYSSLGKEPSCHNTSDAMATLVGFTHTSDIVYLEQAQTSWRLYTLQVESGISTPLTLGGLPDHGVIGGGFRATARPVLGAGASNTFIGFSHETFNTTQNGYVASIAGEAEWQVTQLNPTAAKHNFPVHRIESWQSPDSVQVEGILILPPGFSESTGAPLIVFTHCGPAMAVLETFVGYGTVCARFPVASLAEKGYLVLMPNYRGSTGYGPGARRSDQNDWGGHDYDDVFSGATNLQKQGLATSVSHMGWSYGGYMSGTDVKMLQMITLIVSSRPWHCQN